MEYLLSVVKKRIKKSKAMDLLIFFQVCVGIMLLTIAISSVVKIDKIRNELRSREEYNKFEIAVAPGKSGEIKDKIFTEEQETVLKRTYVDDYSVEIVISIVTFAGKSHIEAGEEIADCYEIVYSSDETRIRADRDFIEAVKFANNKNTVNYEDIVFRIESGDIVFGEDGRMPYFVETVADSDNCHAIYIPIEFYYQYGVASSFTDCKISVTTDHLTIEQICQKLNQTEMQLYEINPNCSYELSSNYYDFFKAGLEFEKETQTILLFLIPLMVIVFVGVVCFETLLVEKRRFATSVCITLGAGESQIMKEIALELALITVLPTMLGFILSDLIMRLHPIFMGVDICYHSATVVLSLFSAVLIVNICSLFIAYKKTRSKNLTGTIYEEC